MADQAGTLTEARHLASCRCGAIKAEAIGDPVRVSVCHCLSCQQRTGSAFGAQARWPEAQVKVQGTTRSWQRVADSGRKAEYFFCPICGSTIAYTNESFPGLIAVPIGAFADPQFPAPRYSVYENRQHGWVAILGEDVEHSSTPSIERHRPRGQSSDDDS